MADPMTANFERYPFAHEGIAHDVYVHGAGAPLLVMHELPGLAQPAFDFARRLAAQGFRVHLPHLFGPLGRWQPGRNYARLCVSREFGCLSSGRSTPITHWLRGLARHICEIDEARKIGAIGMCLTGAFVIPLILEPCVVAPVTSQPSLPLSVAHLLTGNGGGAAARRLNVDDAEVAEAAARLHQEGRSLLGFRFEDDRLCPAGRFQRLQDEFGDRFEPHVYGDASPAERRGLGRHSVLTEAHDSADPGSVTARQTREAFDRLCAFLRANLTPT